MTLSAAAQGSTYNAAAADDDDDDESDDEDTDDDILNHHQSHQPSADAQSMPHIGRVVFCGGKETLSAEPAVY